MLDAARAAADTERTISTNVAVSERAASSASSYRAALTTAGPPLAAWCCSVETTRR